MTQVILTFDASSAITVALYNAAGTLVTPAPPSVNHPQTRGGTCSHSRPSRLAHTPPSIAAVDSLSAPTQLPGTAAPSWTPPGPSSQHLARSSRDSCQPNCRRRQHQHHPRQRLPPRRRPREFTFTFSGIPSLIGATVSLAFFDSLSGAVTTFSGTVASSTSITIELTAAQTSALAAGDPAYTYDVTATFTDAHTATLQRRPCHRHRLNQ